MQLICQWYMSGEVRREERRAGRVRDAVGQRERPFRIDLDPLGVQPRLDPLAGQPAGHRVDVALHPDGAARLHAQVQREPGRVGEGAKELLEQLVIELSGDARRQRAGKSAQAAPGDVDGTRRACLIHRHHRVAVSNDSCPVAESAIESLADADADVLDGVMGPGLKVSARGDAHRQATMSRHQIEHVIHEADTRATLARAVTLERQVHLDVGFRRLAFDLRSTHQLPPFWPMRASTERA